MTPTPEQLAAERDDFGVVNGNLVRYMPRSSRIDSGAQYDTADTPEGPVREQSPWRAILYPCLMWLAIAVIISVVLGALAAWFVGVWV